MLLGHRAAAHGRRRLQLRGACLVADSMQALWQLLTEALLLALWQSWRLAHPTPTAVPPREGLMTYNEYLEGVLKPDKGPKKAAKARFTKPGGVGVAVITGLVK